MKSDIRELRKDEIELVNGGDISFSDAVGMGHFSAGAGAAYAGTGIGLVGSAALVGGLIAGTGYASYAGATALGAGSLGKALGNWAFNTFE